MIIIFSITINKCKSSSNLKDKEEGDFIDSFDEVVRFNRAPTKGWEKYVGSKTTVRVANNHVFSNVKHNVGGEEDCDDWKAEGQPQYFIKEQINYIATIVGINLY